MTKQFTKELVGVLPPLLAESPCSWITRNALRQVVTPEQLCRYFRIWGRGDLDFALTGSEAFRIAGTCGIQTKKFCWMRMMFRRLKVIDRTGSEFLLSSAGVPRYRFCPACLSIPGQKYFPLHWRFKCWRACPSHNCLMEDGCPKCAAPVLLPRDLLTAGAEGNGVASLARCLACGASLSVSAERKAAILVPSLLTHWERMQLTNGRAVLAALFHGHGYASTGKECISLRKVRQFLKCGIIPHENFSLDADELRLRLSEGLNGLKTAPT